VGSALPMYGALIIGLIYLLYSLPIFGSGTAGSWGDRMELRHELRNNFTVGTGLLSLVLGGSVITDACIT